jgi:hypothetical protein
MTGASGVVVPSRRGERRDALSDGVDVEPVEPGRQPPNHGSHQDLVLLLGELHHPDRRPCGVAELGTALRLVVSRRSGKSQRCDRQGPKDRTGDNPQLPFRGVDMCASFPSRPQSEIDLTDEPSMTFLPTLATGLRERVRILHGAFDRKALISRLK